MNITAQVIKMTPKTTNMIDHALRKKSLQSKPVFPDEVTLLQMAIYPKSHLHQNYPQIWQPAGIELVLHICEAVPPKARCGVSKKNKQQTTCLFPRLLAPAHYKLVQVIDNPGTRNKILTTSKKGHSIFWE